MKRTHLFLTAMALSASPTVAIAQNATSVQPVPSASAQPTRPGTIETARKLVGALHLDQSYERIFQPIIPMMVAGVLPAMEKDTTLPDPIRQELQTADGKKRIGRIVAEEFLNAFRARYPQMEEATAKEYAVRFSEDELQAILAFYTSGVGAKVLKLTPEISAKMQSVGGDIGREAGKEAYTHVLDRLDARRGT